MVNENSFFPVLRSLSRHPAVEDSPPTYKAILYTILDRMAWEPVTLYDHGIKIDLKPGQYMTTRRSLAKLVGCDKNMIDRALEYFRSSQISSQEVRHTKTIITISSAYIYNKEKEYGGTRFEPRSSQDRAINNNNTNKEEIINISKNGEAPEKKAYRNHVFLTAMEYTLLVEQFGQDKTQEMLDQHNQHKIKSGNQYASDYKQILSYESYQKKNKIQPLGHMYDELKF